MDISFYENLITRRNSSKKKFMEWVHAVLSPAVDLGAVVESMDFAFNLDNAAGNQLDTLGEIVGIKRLLPFAPSEGDRVMSDDEYRMMIRMKIGRNYWDGTNGQVIDLYSGLISNGSRIRYVDNQNLSIDIFIDGTASTRDVEILNATNNLPFPMGVRQTVSMIGSAISVGMYFGAVAVGIETYDQVTVS